MKRNGVEVEIERDPSLKSKLSDLIKPKLHQVRRGRRGDPTTVCGEKGPFGHNVETGPESQPFIEYIAHDMAVPCVYEQLECQKGAHGVVSWYLLGTWEVRFVKDVLEWDLG